VGSERRTDEVALHFLDPSSADFEATSCHLSLSCMAFVTNTVLLDRVAMKSSNIPADSGSLKSVDIRPSGGIDSFDTPLEESSLAIPHHPLDVKPLGNKYTATGDGKNSVGYFQILPDEIIAIFLEYLDSSELLLLGSTCKFLYAFCRSDDVWKALFIE
jgi:hypothetical protein